MSDNTNTILVWVLAGIGAALLLCCGIGLGVFVWVGRSVDTMVEDVGTVIEAGIDEGLEEFDRQVQADIEDHPVIVEHIGAITELKHDFDLSTDEPGDVWVFHISGDKGSGLLRANCVTIDEWTEQVDAGELTLDSGEVYELFPENPISNYE